MTPEESKTNKPTTNWRKEIPALEKIHKYLLNSYVDLEDFRKRYDKIQTAYDNAFDIKIADEERDPDLIRSSIIKEGVDIFSGGMLFPEWNVDAIITNDAESRTKASLASAALNWMIVECGFEEIYDASKEPMSLHGDVYRKPFKKKIGTGKWYPQYEEFDGRNLLLDTESTELWSKSLGKASTWSATVRIFSESQIEVRFGKEILKFIDDGANIDTTGHAEKVGDSDTGRNTKYYEVIELEDLAGAVELVILGKNFLPLSKKGMLTSKDEEIPKEIKKAGGVWETEYPHKDEFGDPMLSTHNCGFYIDRRRIRNFGLGNRLYRFQKADEALQNTALNASRLRGIQIPVMIGVSSNVAQDRVEEWKERRATDVFAFLDVSGTTPQSIPRVEILKFDGVRAEEMRVSVEDLYASYRNYVGISFTRLETRTTEGLGQSKLLEAEKVKTIEEIVKRQMGKLQHELRGLLLYFINNDGFGLEEVQLEYSLIEGNVESVAGESMGDIENPHATLSLPEIAKELKDFAFKVSINMDTIVDRNQLSILEDLTRITGLVDGAAMPEEKKELLKKIFEIAKIRMSPNAFAGVVNEVAQGGAGQFQGGGEGAVPPEVPPAAPPLPPPA